MADVLGLVGKKLGNYEIDGYIGSGGMSFIYRARQEAFKREVAIKVTSVTDSKLRNEARTYLEFAKRFSREAEVVSRLNHPHILKVFDYGEEGGYIFLVMELHTGGTLASLLQQGRLSLERAQKIIHDLAEALDYSHQHGVIHRDIKPQNVLLDEQGNAILTDFGIAKVLDETTLTRPGSAVGTPTYMSPEQWQGVPLDGRSDQYSLAVMTYEMLSGTLPFPSDTPYSLMTNHLNTPPPPLHLRCADIPETVEYVINKALAKDRAGRFASTKQFAAAYAIAITGKMPSDDPLDTLPPPKRASQAAPKSPLPTTFAPLSPAIGHAQDATLALEPDEIEDQRIRAMQRPRGAWLTMGAAGIVVVIAVLLLMAGNGNLPLSALASSDTPVPTNTATSTLTPEPTATATPEPTATPVPIPTYLTAMFTNNFETDALDNIETNGWQIETDKANKDNHLFCIATGEKQWAQFNLMDSLAWTDYSIEFRAQILKFDQNDTGAGNLQIALRVQERPADGSDPSSYYAGIDALKHNTFLQKWTKEDGGIDLGSGDKAIIDKQWYAVRVEIQGVWMRLFVDGALIQMATDTSLSAGGAGIQTAPKTAACVDDVVVRSLRKTIGTTLDTQTGKLITAQELLNAVEGTSLGTLAEGTEVFILAESADKQYLYVRDDDTALQGWIAASAVKVTQ